MGLVPFSFPVSQSSWTSIKRVMFNSKNVITPLGVLQNAIVFKLNHLKYRIFISMKIENWPIICDPEWRGGYPAFYTNSGLEVEMRDYR